MRLHHLPLPPRQHFRQHGRYGHSEHPGDRNGLPAFTGDIQDYDESREDDEGVSFYFFPECFDQTCLLIFFSFWRRVQLTGTPGMQRRFIDTFDLFFQAVTQQAKDRHSGDVQDLESYIALRRNTSGCKPCWALIEYAYGLDIPDAVMAHHTLEDMGEAANDIVTWSNVSAIFDRYGLSLTLDQLGHFLLQCRAVARGHAQHGCHHHAY